MSRYKAYLEYKDSGVEWLNSIPQHWEVNQLKHACNVYPSNVDKKTYDGEAAVLLCNYTDVYYNEKIDRSLDFMPASASADQIEKFTLRGGDTIITKDSETADDIAIAAYVPDDLSDVICGYHLSVIRPKSNTCGAFVKRLFDSAYAKSNFTVLANGLTRVGLSQYAIDNVAMPWPPAEEQEKIAAFLDRETAKIDALIEKQQRLIELLKEKRQAVISHAVTKGLNPNATMKDSGVEWLGEVPAHWVVTQLKFNTLEMQTGPFGSQLHAEDYVDDGIPLVNPAHMIDGKIVSDSQVTVDENTWQRLSRHQLKSGDLILARRGELGRCAVVTKEQEGWLCGTGSLKAKLNDRLTPEYSYLLITSEGVVSELSLESKGSTMDNLNTETLGRVRLPVPPTGEQIDILEYVHLVAGEFKSLIDKADSAISLMQERRTALISAPVTGKIDVRDWQPAAA